MFGLIICQATVAHVLWTCIAQDESREIENKGKWLGQGCQSDERCDV